MCVSLLLCLQAARIQQYMVIHGRHVYILVTLSSMLALTYNVVHSLMILHTSAVSTTVIGEAKIIGLLILSYFVLGVRQPQQCFELSSVPTWSHFE